MREKKPLVSILVPVYNVSRYLRQCLDSLVGQTLKEIEIICVNDGSTDSSLQILNEYAEADKRVIIVNKPNGGLPSARNAGLDIARGKYIGFVDSDDYVDVNMFRIMYNAACINSADIVVCGGHPFPNEEMAPVWLKDVLSPRDIVYKTGGNEALFVERGAKPFIWRDMIRKDLIDKHNLRLDESIVVGEDQAFQFKVFPLAKNITFISDKLYYYRYSRPESIMNEPQYKDYGSRVFKHVNMIAGIVSSWKQELTKPDSAVRFFEWSVDFLYWDIIRVSAVDRVEIARKFCKVLIDAGYYNFYKDYSWDTRNHFDYMYGLTTYKAEQPLVSIVAIMGRNSEYISAFLDSVLAQSERRIEILLYENESDDATKNIVREKLVHDNRICVRLGEWQPVSQKYNDAIQTAKGKYICFLNAFDYIQDVDWLQKSLNYFQDPEISLVGYHEDVVNRNKVVKCQNGNYRQFLYRIDKIRKNKIWFKDYALLTGSVFFTKYCLVSDYAFFISKFMMKGKTFKRQSIYADEAKLIMRAFVWLLQTAKENNLMFLTERITDLLNSENYVRLITDATYGFYLDESSIDNPKEDFHSEVFALLVKANSLAQLGSNDRAVLRTLAAFIAQRHQFLEKI